MKLVAIALAASALALTAAAETTEDASATSEATPQYTVAEAKTDPAHWRAVDPENLFIFDTTEGRVVIEAFPEIAPKHYKQFSTIIRSGMYSGTKFHRVIEGFMAQGGDIRAINGEGSGLPNIEAEFTFQRKPEEMPLEYAIGYPEDAEGGFIKGFPIATRPLWIAQDFGNETVESWIPHCQGVVSTARLGDNVNSGNSQFFLMRGYADHLDKDYTAWGRVISGQDVVMSLKKGPDARDGLVTDPDILNSASVAADMPAAERPKAWVMRTDTEEFVETLDLKEGDLPHVCDLPAVPAVVEN
ncbi:peptidylprolyl isomerase [Hyphomonas pacifica]|uniref:peptidylprolyl isomerase n=1 Tax=Hyphomonas pacifica TaxID=1280941 RepID=UPI000DBF9E55|nr:peptidylprolyl isomerase [Hyphomonas pacifica]RAN38374.1 hypothetical protein HY11_00755 [Hyphomonas pacifica]